MRRAYRAASAAGALLVLGGEGMLAAQSPASVALVDPKVDHVLISLPSELFADLDRFLAAELGEGWFLVPDHSKGFLRSREGRAYVEIFDRGSRGAPMAVGYQIAISSSDGNDGKSKAVAYYGQEGLQRDFVFTVGRNFQAGDALGGTFFVSYASAPGTTVDETPVANIVTLVTVMPRFRMEETETFRAFGFTSRATPGGVVIRDSAGLSVCFIETANDDRSSFGHAALQFRLVRPITEGRTVLIGTSGMMKAVFEGEHLWLLLRADLFDPDISSRGC